jgi:hypothetical protein
LSGVDRVEKKTGIRAHDLEIDPGADLRSLFEVKLERAGDRSIQETEAVLAWLNLEVRPRLSVNVDDIAKEIGGLAVRFGTPETAVWVVSLGGQSERDIVVALRESGNCLFLVVVEDVKSGLAHVGVLSGVVDCMIVVPFFNN